MGSRISKAVRPHGQAAASPIACAVIHNKSDEANAQARQDPARHLPAICSHDDIGVLNSTATSTILRRRDSAPSRSTTTTSTTMDQDRAAALGLFLIERQFMDIDYAAVDSSSPVPTITLPPPPPEVIVLPSPVQEELDIQCLTCCTQLPRVQEPNHIKDVLYPCKCGSAFCTSCIKDMFTDACKDLTRMPPKCCAPIHLHHARPFLSEEEVALFKARYEEWSTRKPFYCPVATCSAFIPERLLPERAKTKAKNKRVDSGVGTPTASTFTCPTCVADICADCRQLAHPNSLCKVAEFGLDEETAALLKAWGYKKCPKCGHGLKRMFGCNHMECRCGAHFCWVCLESKNDCDGGCGDDEDYDEGSEPDEPEDLEEPVQPLTRSNTIDATLPQHRANDSQDGSIATIVVQDIATQAVTSTTATVLPIVRPRNLDAGSHSYWEDQDLDFGDEPNIGDQDKAWHCHHNFSTYKITLAKALGNGPSGTEMDCVKCWRTIYPEISAPTAAAAASETRTVPAGANGRPRGIVRAGGRGGSRWHPPRGLFQANATVGTAPHLISTLSALSQSVPLREASPMEDVQFTDRIVDTYGNIITSKELDIPRRASVDTSFTKHTNISAASASSVLSTPTDTFSFAHECHFCNLLVCSSCKDAILAAQTSDEDVQDTPVPGEVNEADDGESDSDDDFFAPPSLFD